jgi:hypothetical protein
MGGMKIIQGQSSWRIASDRVEAFVTKLGGQIAPITFDRQGRKIAPYSVAPWAEEKLKMPAILQALRGDFFCLPFGGNATPYRGEKHPMHGETANAKWRLVSEERGGGRHSLHLSLQTRVRPGRVDKEISLADGEDTVYSRHTIRGMSGPMCLGHHAMLKFPEAEGSGAISTSRFVYGQVLPTVFEQPEMGGYTALKMGAEFRSLEAVPTAAGGLADLSRYPARRGFEDLVMVVSDAELPLAWTAVAFPRERFVWFALKDPKVLRETVLWISNRGRHYPPWSSRHVNVMGLEEVTANFHLGLAASAGANAISAKGWPTCLMLEKEKPLVVNYIMGVAAIPAGFDRVEAIEPGADGKSITLRSAGGRKAVAKVDLGFLGQESRTK